jgi:hypothetical protein
MLVTFTTKAYADITMFGDVARAMLKMMGHSDTVPGAILADDVPGALESLKKSLESIAATQANGKPKDDARDESGERPVSLAHRALPLIELLTAAARQHADVMWE